MTKDEEYIRALALLIPREEDLTDTEVRPLLLALALRIRNLILTLPESPLARQLEYPRLRTTLLPQIQTTSTRIYTILRTHLSPVERSATTAAATLLDTPPQPPRPLPQLITDTRIRFQSLLALFAPRGTQISDFATQLLRLLDKTIQAAFFRNDPTAEIADRIVTTTRRNRPTFTKGTVANAWRSRTKAITAATFWAIAFAAQQRAAAISSTPITSWTWNAILDPKTCPICRPLHNTTAPTPSAFPSGPPPIHPFCRCVVLPTTTP
jgi:SPP1 gp7 family putative phage head morphogenesis protein